MGNDLRHFNVSKIINLKAFLALPTHNIIIFLLYITNTWEETWRNWWTSSVLYNLKRVVVAKWYVQYTSSNVYCFELKDLKGLASSQIVMVFNWIVSYQIRTVILLCVHFQKLRIHSLTSQCNFFLLPNKILIKLVFLIVCWFSVISSRQLCWV